MVRIVKISLLILVYLLNVAHTFYPHSYEIENCANLKKLISHTNNHDHDALSFAFSHSHDYIDDTELPSHHNHCLQRHEYLQVRNININPSDNKVFFLDRLFTESNTLEIEEPESYSCIEINIYNSVIRHSIGLRAPPQFA